MQQQQWFRTLPAFVLALVFPYGEVGADTQLLWGDTHLHTSNSFDAFLRENLSADPETAYRYAKGLPVIHPYHRARVQIDTPLDFLVVADHAEYLGVIRKVYEGGEEITESEKTKTLRALIDASRGWQIFLSVLPNPGQQRGIRRPAIVDNADDLSATVWADASAIADRHNDPGKFTALIGWEWSSMPDGANLHRVVFTSATGAEARKFIPYSSLESDRPEDLWAWLDKTKADLGFDFVSIPHNSNISKGLMFAETDSEGQALTVDYARSRSRWEPVAEATQIKGDSETHPDLSPDDPFADFEEYPYYIQQVAEEYVARAGDYVRPALKRGLELASKLGTNPYQFGLIGSTDAHTGLASAEETNFWGKMAIDSTPESKELFAPGRGITGWSMSASGLAAVWAEENTREAILDAFQRKEVYATTGPRIRLRFFGGWEFDERDANSAAAAEIGYRKGVPMGGMLGEQPGTRAPTFLVVALCDPNAANLDRIQIIKGWLDADGASHEQVIDVAWSDGRHPDSDGQVPAVGNSVNLVTGGYDNDIGAPTLAVVWNDPGFDPSQRAFYYARVLQIPTPRHSLYDAIALGKENIDGFPATIQERAYSSPIWFEPAE